VSAGRRRYARVVLRTALKTAIRWRLITMNAATLIDAPRTTSREIRPLNPDEARALLDACREHPLDAFVTVALACGLRLGEALGLQWAESWLRVDEFCRNAARAAERDATVQALLTAAKLPDMRLHDLRHSCATLLLAQGVNLRVVMETLGHSQVSLTLNTYSHVLPALQQDAAATMDAILSK
jgi:integrase